MSVSFRRIKVEDRDLRLVQDSVDSVFNVVLPSPIIYGRLIKDIEFTVAGGLVASVEHKLPNGLQGWFLVRRPANVEVWDNQDTNPVPKRTLNLQASAATKVSIWVF